MLPENPSEQTQKPEKFQIPKSREIFSGDINAAVITVQLVTGVEISPDWWDKHVQKGGTVQDTGQILDNFDEAFEQLIEADPDIETLEFSDRDLAELKAIEELETALKDGTIKEEDLDQYVRDLRLWLNARTNAEETLISDDKLEKEEYERPILDRLSPASERKQVVVPNTIGVVFELNSHRDDLDNLTSEAMSEALGLIADLGVDLPELTIVLCDDGVISGGGQALARENIIALNIAKPSSIEDTEAKLVKLGFLNPRDWSKLSVPGNNAIALTLIHEIGHILEFRKTGDYGSTLSALDTNSSPTKYGRTDPSEDFAESFTYMVLGETIDNRREELIRRLLGLV